MEIVSFLSSAYGGKEKGCGTEEVDLPSTNVDIEFINITMTVTEGFITKRKKTILNNVSGHFQSGQLTAIMGPSGAGKSTLMNALTGFSVQGVTGIIRAGNDICKLGQDGGLRNLKAYKKKSCYILQDDRLNPLFTVYELMKFAADVKLGGSPTFKMKMTLIDEILETLSMTSVKNTRCLNLSGGQKKRLSIGVELLDNHPVVFLDEPTTGLDSLSSVQCIQMLRNLARGGKTVVCSVHQPSASIYSMFDQVYILADGMSVYQGSSENTLPFLASVGLHCRMYHNPADFILEITNGEYGKINDILSRESMKFDWRKKTLPELCLKTSLAWNKSSVAINNPSEFYKFRILVERCVLQNYRDWTVTHLKVILHIVIGILLGLLYQGAGIDGSKIINNLGFLIISIVYHCYTSLMPAVLKFPSELPVLKKENFNNWYSLRSYYAATLVTSMPIQIVFSVVYSIPSYLLTNQPLEWPRFLMFVLMLSCMALLAEGIGNVIGTCVNPINGTFFGAVTTCVLVLFAGFIILFNHMSSFMRYVSYISCMRYAFEGLVLAMYSNGRKPIVCPDNKDVCYSFRYPSYLIKEFYFVPDNYWFDFSILLIQIVIIRLVAFWTLKNYVKRGK